MTEHIARNRAYDLARQYVKAEKERFNAALNEAKARFDLYKRGLTKVPQCG